MAVQTLSRLVVAILLVSLPAPLAAQYFGRNKVQYEELDFRVMATPNFDLYFYERESEQAVTDASHMAERWHERLGRFFGGGLEARKPIILYADKADFRQTNTVTGPISETTGGVTESIKNRVILPMGSTQGETDHVLGHELVHAFQYDLAGSRSGGGPTGLSRLPLWMVEGLAEYLSVGRTSTLTGMWLRDAIDRDAFPTVKDLAQDPRTYFPYRFGHAFYAWVGGRWGDDVARTLYLNATEQGAQTAIRNTLRLPVDTVSRLWRQDTEAHYRPLLADRSEPGEAARLVLGPGRDAGTLNLAPALSPEGSRVLFWSQRDLFTMDLYIADVSTGRIQSRVSSGIRNQHFDGLAFSESAGSWSPDGGRIAFAVYDQGDIRITVARADGRVQRVYALPGIGAVGALSWSPDGDRIAFAGRAGGLPDLYLLELGSGEVDRLTDGPRAEIHPDWSPDGTTLAFATDAGTDGPLHRPRPGIGLLDLEAGSERILRPFGAARHVNPRFDPEGTGLYFIADPDGFSDIYHVSLGDGALRRVTRLRTGVTGLTEHAPALAVARGSGDVVFTAFTGGDYLGYALSAEEAGSASLPLPEDSDRPGSGALLPPRPPAPEVVDVVERYLAAPSVGLPPGDTVYPSSPYDPDLELDYLAQPTAGVAVSSFGTAIGGSVAAFFSDMLGNQRMAVGLVANGGFKDIGGELMYARLGRRFNWGVRAGRIPYRSAFATSGIDTLQGEPVRSVSIVTERTYQTRADLFGEYPFSTTRRVEVGGGFTRYAYDLEVDRAFLVNGRVVGREESDLSAPSALNLFHSSVALVQDRSTFGIASPVRGDRARLEVEGYTGTIDFYELLADYRRYLLADPVTFAARALHYGRYGSGADSQRLSPLFLGFEQFVRGYASGSFRGSECTPAPGDERRCPEFDRLLGTRLAVANVELRVPLLGTEAYGLIPFRFLPTELHVFGDAGVAWTGSEGPDLVFEGRSAGRVPVFSAGAGARFNLFGRAVLEVYWAYPFQRPDRGGHFGFFLAPGW